MRFTRSKPLPTIALVVILIASALVSGSIIAILLARAMAAAFAATGNL